MSPSEMRTFAIEMGGTVRDELVRSTERIANSRNSSVLWNRPIDKSYELWYQKHGNSFLDMTIKHLAANLSKEKQNKRSMNIFEAIRKDHDIQRDLCDKLVATSGKTKERKALWDALQHELSVHADAEERYFYIPLIEEDMTQEHARHGVAEHHEMDELIEQINEADMDSSAWLTYAKQLREKVFHHLEDEERTIFQLAGKVLSDKQKAELETSYRKHMVKEDAGIKTEK